MQSKPRWVVLGVEDIGFHEKGDNQGIQKFIRQARCGQLGDPWCAIWVNAKLEESGVAGTRSASSQSFRYSPNFLGIDGPALGAIVVYWRVSQNSGLGHVGFYMGETDTQILTLGGNESNAVREQFEPKHCLIGYWWPRSDAPPNIEPILVASQAGHPVSRVT